MLSILIPVYKYNVVPFIKDLHQSAVDSGIVFEIRIYDDGSGEKWTKTNEVLGDLDCVVYQSLPNNIGRSAIRNKLAEEANYPHLLFIDGDSALVNTNYIASMTKALKGNNVLVGKTSYRDKPPKEKDQYLRWLFGVNRESIMAIDRQKKPYNAFKTHHFLIKKDLFLSIKFNEDISEYGHEDTLFGFELKQRSLPIQHLEYPLYHEGLESAAAFLQKTDQAILNLFLINRKEERIETRLWSMYKKINKLPGLPILLPIFKIILKTTRANLISSQPNLSLLDLYKLSKLIIIAVENRN